jgi:hypothetical protein
MLSIDDPMFFEKATPATRPFSMSLKAGPPLLPGLMAASDQASLLLVLSEVTLVCVIARQYSLDAH